jgi:tetratricopeptide (TPR) repeat protein
MAGYIDLKKLNLDELVGVVNLYPWYSGARKELCMRMSRMGADVWSESQFAEAAMYLPFRKVLSDIIRSARTQDLGDADVEAVIKSYIAADQKKQEVVTPSRRVYAGAGDYFSQEDYDRAAKERGNIFSRSAFRARKDDVEYVAPTPDYDFYTETLAQIYAEQGYYEQAKDIYAKLILAYPEKNAYFAALIEKLDELN